MQMNIDSFNVLLSKIDALISREKAIQEEKYKRGESFNIFKVCGVNHYEVTHSSILAELLDPKGSHGQGGLFLKEFLVTAGVYDPQYRDCNDFIVNTEHSFFINTNNGICTGRIDIIISSPTAAIIIENKIYAADQQDQLKRYDTYLKASQWKNNYKILYLTLDNHDPGDENSKNVCYTPISYKDDIIKWLLKAIQLIDDKPIIRETIYQYIQHLRTLTNTIDMNDTNKNEMLDYMLKHSDATLRIIKMKEDFENHVISNIVLNSLKTVANRYNFELKFDLDELSVRSKCLGFEFIPYPTSKWSIAFEFQCSNLRQCCIGVFTKDGNFTPTQTKKLDIFSYEPTIQWFYGWDYLREYRDWDIETLVRIADNPQAFENYLIGTINRIIVALQTERFDSEHIGNWCNII